jgi:hypothetical protein
MLLPNKQRITQCGKITKVPCRLSHAKVGFKQISVLRTGLTAPQTVIQREWGTICGWVSGSETDCTYPSLTQDVIKTKFTMNGALLLHRETFCLMAHLYGK